MRIKCAFHDCEKRSPRLGFLDWFLTGLLMPLDWRFWLCEEHRSTDFEEVEAELRRHGKLV